MPKDSRLSDEQWDRIRKHFPEEHIPDDRPGRKPLPTRRVLEAVLWILNTGAQWHMLPQSVSELQNGASALSDVVQQRGSAWRANGCFNYFNSGKRVQISESKKAITLEPRARPPCGFMFLRGTTAACDKAIKFSFVPDEIQLGPPHG